MREGVIHGACPADGEAGGEADVEDGVEAFVNIW
jgi:hypothetical protein